MGDIGLRANKSPKYAIHGISGYFFECARSLVTDQLIGMRNDEIELSISSLKNFQNFIAELLAQTRCGDL